MDATRLTLLQQAGGGEPQAWAELDRLYRPFVRGWYRAQGVPRADADDLTQEVLAALALELPAFEHNGRTGAFRTWLRAACLHRLLGHRRGERRRGRPVGGSDFQERLHEIEGAASNAWDREHDRAVLRHLFARISAEFEPATLEAFEQLVMEERPAATVASALGMTVGAVYVAKSRVLRRLREEATRLIGDDLAASNVDEQKTSQAM
jgi:RNA polymerase sigma-70 factor (ECF subfamily)